MPIHGRAVCGHSPATAAELSTSHRDLRPPEPQLLTVWPFADKVCQSLPKGQNIAPHPPTEDVYVLHSWNLCKCYLMWQKELLKYDYVKDPETLACIIHVGPV